MMAESIEKKITSIEVLSITLLFFKLALVVVVVWFWGYIGFSVSWLFLALLAYILNEKYRRQKKIEIDVGHEVATDEQKSIVTRMTDLPSWVFFPDMERAEWLNKIVKQLWPFIANYVQDLLQNVIEPSIRKSLPEYLRSFKFARIELGNIAPRIGGIKVYAGNHVRRDEIILDVEIYYYGDADIKVGIRGITAGIKDLEIRGTLRVCLQPLIPRIPLIGAVTISFLNNPTINFDLTDFGNALDFPGLSDLLRSIVSEAVGKIIVLPNRLPVTLVKGLDVDKLRYPVPHGVVRIKVIAAEELKKADINLLGQGKSDPYCVLKLGTSTFKTKVIKNTLDPEWNEVFEAVADQRSGQVLDITVFDKDEGNKDDFLGRTEIDLESVSKTGKLDTWLHLEDIKSGSIHLNLSWLSLSPSPGAFTDAYAQAEIDADGTDTHLHAGYLQVILDSARNLPSIKRNDEPSPYAVIQLANDHQESEVKSTTSNPSWEQAFSFLISNPHVDSLTVTLKDKKSSQSLGYVHMPLKLLLSEPNMAVNRPFPLKESNPIATVQMRLTLRALAVRSQRQTDGVDGEETEDGVDEDEADAHAGLDRSQDLPVGSPSHSTTPSLLNPDISQLNGSLNHSTPGKGDQDSETRRRQAGGGPDELEGGVHQYGRLQLTLRYSPHRMCLVVVVHKASQLIACDEDGSSDPYVKLLILPKSLQSKKKTQVIKNCLNPTFDETFDLPLGQADVPRSTLRLEVRNHVGRFSRGRKHMGFIEIPLSRLDLTHAVTNWYKIKSRFDLRPSDGSHDHSSIGSNNL